MIFRARKVLYINMLQNYCLTLFNRKILLKYLANIKISATFAADI